MTTSRNLGLAAAFAALALLYALPAIAPRAIVQDLFGILTLLVIYVTMVYGPIAAALVELFPTRIRYTSMSLPYHIGNGWFGGLMPATAFAMIAQTGDVYFGLWYPIVIALATVVIGAFMIPETKDRDIFAENDDGSASTRSYKAAAE